MRNLLLAAVLFLGAGQALAAEWSVVSTREESKDNRRLLFVEVMSSDVFPHPLHFRPEANDEKGRRIPVGGPRTVKRSPTGKTFEFKLDENLLAQGGGAVFELTLSVKGSGYPDLHFSYRVGKEKPVPGAAPK